MASRLARYQAAGGQATNLWHESVPLDDLERRVLAHLDGKADREDLTHKLFDEVQRSRLVIQDGSRLVSDEAPSAKSSTTT